MSTNIATELGVEIGRELLVDRDAQGAPRIAAKELVCALLEVNPRAKLPSLLEKDKVRSWMAEARVTESMLREELASARKAIRATSSEPDLKRPPKRRRSGKPEMLTASQPLRAAPLSRPLSNPAPSGDMFDDGMVPN